jgi:hypothetical protein
MPCVRSNVSHAIPQRDSEESGADLTQPERVILGVLAAS